MEGYSLSFLPALSQQMLSCAYTCSAVAVGLKCLEEYMSEWLNYVRKKPGFYSKDYNNARTIPWNQNNLMHPNNSLATGKC